MVRFTEITSLVIHGNHLVFCHGARTIATIKMPQDYYGDVLHIAEFLESHYRSGAKVITIDDINKLMGAPHEN